MTPLRPGETCWRLERATRLAFLVDTEAYYAALFEALNKAKLSIWILGWAFDPRTRLAPDGREGARDPDEVGEILLRLTAANPALDVRLLIWKAPLSINGSHALFEHRARKAFQGSAVRYREDADTPFGACHHQKVVVIDGELAFCGGGDIAVNRWDTLHHLHEDPRRILPDRGRHPPRHETMMLVQGPVAAALADLFRQRWSRACGEALPADRRGALWPGTQPSHLSAVEVAIARTEPEHAGRPLVDEILRLHLACIERACASIYLENQYFTSHLVTAALEARLREPDGPEVVLLLSRRAPSWFDRLTMEPARTPMLRRLIAADRHGRFRAYAPRTAAGEPIVVHAKAGVFDDDVVRIGSANLNNRAEGFDTECELALHATDDRTRAEIVQFRDVLIAHYLGVSEREFALAREPLGKLIPTIESLNGRGRLCRLTADHIGWWEGVTARCRLGDPAGVPESWRLLKGPRLPPVPVPHRGQERGRRGLSVEG